MQHLYLLAVCYVGGASLSTHSHTQHIDTTFFESLSLLPHLLSLFPPAFTDHSHWATHRRHRVSAAQQLRPQTANKSPLRDRVTIDIVSPWPSHRVIVVTTAQHRRTGNHSYSTLIFGGGFAWLVWLLACGQQWVNGNCILIGLGQPKCRGWT